MKIFNVCLCELEGKQLPVYEDHLKLVDQKQKSNSERNKNKDI